MVKKLLALFLTMTLLLIITSACGCSDKKQENDFLAQSTVQNSEEDKDKHTVVFKDYDGKIIKTEEVDHGGQAKPPVGLKRDGYKFSKWDKPVNKITGDLVVKAVYEEIKKPTLIVDTVYTQDEDVVVKVYIKKNPGILTLLLNIIYVENAMNLVKVESGKAMEGYTFTAPKNLSNACNIAWHILDVPQNVTDGEIALLHFKLKEGVPPGAYEISATCNHGAYDAQYKEIPFESIGGFIIVNSTTKAKEGSE